ncbi:hypothetical protein MMC07_009431, partial [Pseudocyphellaria aurata]|nr:hypothetical protein [Pseudocyphellaria aurata]
DLDLQSKCSEVNTFLADLLVTGRFDLIEQNLQLRLCNTFVRRVPRLRHRTNGFTPCSSISLWSEHVYMLNVIGEKIEGPGSYAFNSVIMEDRVEMKYSSFISKIPRILNALPDQARYLITHAEKYPSGDVNRPIYHLTNCVPYFHIDKPQQLERMLPELAGRDREMTEAVFDICKCKPLFMLASLPHFKSHDAIRRGGR